MNIVLIAALVCLVISFVMAIVNRAMPSPLEWAVWSIAILAVFGRIDI